MKRPKSIRVKKPHRVETTERKEQMQMTMKITMILKWSRRRRGKTRINLRSPSFKDTMSEEYWMLRRIRRVTKSQNLLMLDRGRRRMLM